MNFFRSKDEDEEEAGSFAAELASMGQFDEEFGTDSPVIGQGPDTQQTCIKWSRPDPPHLDPAKHDLIFQQIEIDHYVGKEQSDFLLESVNNELKNY